MNDQFAFPSRPSHSTVPFPKVSVQDVDEIPSPSRLQSPLWPKIKSLVSTSYTVGAKALKAAFYIFLFFALIGGFSNDSGAGYQTLYGKGEDQIAVVDLSGVIMESSSASPFASEQIITPNGVTKVFETLQNNSKIKAVVLRINSPGGSVTASEEIYQLIRIYRQKLNVPIIASMGETAASGGYYISLAADQIIANSTTFTGSIGVILQTLNFSELADKYGVKNVVIKSGVNKNLLDPFQPVEDSQVALMQQTVDEAYELFTSRIQERRKLDPVSLAPLADGRVLSGKQAQIGGLVDTIGTFRDAIDSTAKLVNLQEFQVVQYGQPSFVESLLGSVIKNFKLNVSLTPDLIGSSLRGKPSYLYQF